MDKASLRKVDASLVLEILASLQTALMTKFQVRIELANSHWTSMMLSVDPLTTTDYTVTNASIRASCPIEYILHGDPVSDDAAVHGKIPFEVEMLAKSAASVSS